MSLPLDAVASEGTDGCNPNRPASLDGGHGPFYRWAGWMYNAPSGTLLGGATVSLNTYSPYVPTDMTYQWSMLTDQSTTSNFYYQYAQLGYYEQKDNGAGGTTRLYAALASGPNTGGVQVGGGSINVQPGQTSIHPALESRHTYSTLWGNVSNVYSFQLDGQNFVDSAGNQLTYDPGFQATTAWVASETHTAGTQLAGDQTHPLDMQSAGWVVKGSQSWQPFNATGTAFLTNWQAWNPPNNVSVTQFYGNTPISNNEDKVWDWGCRTFGSQPSLVGVYMAGASLAVHEATRGSMYLTNNLDTGTPWPPSNGVGLEYLTGDWNHDGIPDLWLVQYASSGSGHTEVHILDGASHFQTRLLDVATRLPLYSPDSVQFGVSDYNRDGTLDLMMAQLDTVSQPTGSGTGEIHTISGSGGTFQVPLLDTATNWSGAIDPTQWSIGFGDYNHDGVPDMYFIRKVGTGSGKVEVHVQSGAAPLVRLDDAATLWTATSAASQFDIADFNGDGLLDVIFVQMQATTSGYTEAHVANALQNFTQPLWDGQTSNGLTTNSQWQWPVNRSGYE